MAKRSEIAETPFQIDSETDVREILDLYSKPNSTPYILLHTWGEPDENGEVKTKTPEDFITEILKGESTLSLEYDTRSSRAKLVRNLTGTGTMRITHQRSRADPIQILQEFRRQKDGRLKPRKHRHSSVSEKISRQERDAIGIRKTDDWRTQWDEICVTYANRTIDSIALAAIREYSRRILREELGLEVTDDDIGFDRLFLIPFKYWETQDQAVALNEEDGTHKSEPFPGFWTRNNILPMLWLMPTFSSVGHRLFADHYAEPNTNHEFFWGNDSPNG